MVNVKKLDHVGTNAVDPSSLCQFYEAVIGLSSASKRSDGSILMSCNQKHVLTLFPSAKRSLNHLGLELDAPQSLESAAKELKDAGITFRNGGVENPKSSQAITFDDPDGLKIELHKEPVRYDSDGEPRGIGPLKLNHVMLYTRDLERSVDFYTKVLGFKISDIVPDMMTWMRCNPNHHTIVVVKQDVAGMHHHAYEVADWGDFKRAGDILARHNVKILWGPGRHGAGNNLFIYMPDSEGNKVEIMAEMIQIWHDDDYKTVVWHDRNAAALKWGPRPVDEFFPL